MSEVVVASRVRLARNYADLPFRSHITPAQADTCVQRTLDALRFLQEPFSYLPLRDLEENEKKVMAEAQLISPDLLEHPESGAVLLSRDRRIAVMMNEEDHLRIQASAPGDHLSDAAQSVFTIEDTLQRHLSFAFDPQLGYLTACPTNAGTGLRASVILHLPVLTVNKQMGKIHQLAVRLGLSIRGVYGEGSEALGCLYQLSSQASLGRTEEETIEAVSATARQIAELELTNREKALENDPVGLEDQLFRSYGLMRHARRMPLRECMTHWSNLRLGSAMKKLPLSLDACDRILLKTQPAHVIKAFKMPLSDLELNQRRSDLIRTIIKQEGEATHGDLRSV